MFKVRLFGAGQATYFDRPLVGFPTQQCHLLLTYLLLTPRHALGRERLAAVFWGDYPTATSRTYLRTALWRLRGALEAVGVPAAAYLQADALAIRFEPAEPYWSDVEDFEQAIAKAQDVPGGALTAGQARALERATDLYTGDLLEGIFEEWCLCERERLRALYVDALGKLGAYHERGGNYELGLVYSTRLLCMDATCESAHRQAMRLYWRMGNRPEALAQYRRCEQILHEELGVAPTQETRALHDQVVQNHWQAPDPRGNGLVAPPSELHLLAYPSVLPAKPHIQPPPASEPRSLDAGALAQDALAQLRHVQSVVKQSIAELLATEALLEQALSRATGQPPALTPQPVRADSNNTRRPAL